MITTVIQGDLIKAFKDDKTIYAIVHGCNCFNTMGAGIALPIKQNFPAAYAADLKTERGDKNKLGDYTFAQTEYGTVINAYTQYDFISFPGIINCDYDATKKVFEKLNIDFKGKKIGIPKIGCGLAGGDWEIVSEIINKATPDVDIVCFVL